MAWKHAGIAFALWLTAESAGAKVVVFDAPPGWNPDLEKTSCANADARPETKRRKDYSDTCEHNGGGGGGGEVGGSTGAIGASSGGGAGVAGGSLAANNGTTTGGATTGGSTTGGTTTGGTTTGGSTTDGSTTGGSTTGGTTTGGSTTGGTTAGGPSNGGATPGGGSTPIEPVDVADGGSSSENVGGFLPIYHTDPPVTDVFNSIPPTPVPAVPEPGTWALLLAGFSVIGLLSWRRGRTSSATTTFPAPKRGLRTSR